MEVLVAVLILIHFSTMNVTAATNISRPMDPFTYGEVENSGYGYGNGSLGEGKRWATQNWEIEPIYTKLFYYIDAPSPTTMWINWGIEIDSPEIFDISGRPEIVDNSGRLEIFDKSGRLEIFDNSGRLEIFENSGRPEIVDISGRPDNTFSPVVAVSYSGNETVANATNTTTVHLTNATEVNQTVLVGYRMKLCRTLVFCEYSAFNICNKTKLSNCQHCSVWKYAVSTTVVTLLGLLIVIGNSAVIWSVWKNKKEEKSISQLLKTSLAVADLCSGIYLFVSFLPNIIWTANHTFNELRTSLIELRGTTQTSIIGILFLLIFLSNLYQLTAYCLIRLYVTVYPFATQSFTTNFSIKLILGVWILAFISATLPLWFPTVFAFTYQHDYFIYWVEVLPNQTSLLYLTALFLYVAIPYFIMTMSTLISLIVVRQKLNKSRQLALQQDAIDKKERIVTKNVAIMILGFTVTTVPFIAVTGLVNSKLIKCGANTNAPTFTFYMFYSRSIINVLVYIATDKKFRQSLFRRSDQNTAATKNAKSISI